MYICIHMWQDPLRTIKSVWRDEWRERESKEMPHFPSGELHLRKMKHFSKAPRKAWQKPGKVSRPLPLCPAYFISRCYWKPSVAKGLCSFQGFSCSFLCIAEFLYDDGAGAARRLFVLSGHVVLAHQFVPWAWTSIKSTHAGVLKM